MQTGCTSNSATWRCFPYATYNESATASMAMFNWVISSSNSASNLTISSTGNPFALVFSDAPLILTDANTATEAYTFSIPASKTVIPATNLTSDGSSTNCYYSNTIFSAKLYTKKAKTFPDNGSNGGQQSTTPSRYWPYAVEAYQIAIGEDRVPSCYKMRNGVQGDFVQIAPPISGQNCSCIYQNFGNT